MRTSMAYFAGAGTALAAVVIGVSGGFVVADIMNPQRSRDMSRLELRHAPQQAEQSAQPSQSGGASQASGAYLAATQHASTMAVVVSPAASSACFLRLFIERSREASATITIASDRFDARSSARWWVASLPRQTTPGCDVGYRQPRPTTQSPVSTSSSTGAGVPT